MSIPTSFNPLGTLGTSPLPPGYRQVKALVSSGTQYIDTEYKLKESSRWELDTRAIDYVYGYCGTYRWHQCYNGIGVYARSTVLEFLVNTGPTTISTNVDAKKRVLATIDIAAQKVSAVWDDIEPFEADANLIVCPDTVALFAWKSSNAYYNPIKNAIYGCRFYENNELVHNLVPVLDANGEACMYDLAGDGDAASRTYRNAGTGTFNYEL